MNYSVDVDGKGEQERVMDYAAWLIEINDAGMAAPVYHQFKMDDDWTKDHDAACHFARKEDAESVIEYYGWTRAKAVEHCWSEPIKREAT